MKNVIIYTNETGGVSICMPTGEIPIEQVQSRDIPGNTQSYIISTDSLPNEYNDFYDAWEQTKGEVTINFIKAQEITRARLRQEREPLLQAQDVLYMRALEAGQDTSAIVAEKNRLRNVTTLVDSANTLEELRALGVQ